MAVFKRGFSMSTMPHRCGMAAVSAVVALSVVACPAAAREPGPFVMFGSSSVSAMGDRLARAFARMHDSRPVNCTPCDSDYVIHLLINNKCHVGLVIESLAAKSPDSLHEGFEAFPLAQYAIAVVVHGHNPVRSMTTDQLGKAFSAGGTWADVAGSADQRRIELYAPLLQRTESYVFRRTILPPGRWFADELRDRTADPPRQQRSRGDIMIAVSSNDAAIGFFQLGPDTMLDERLRLVQVAGRYDTLAVVPNQESIAAGHYAITDRVTLYLHPDAPPAARDFCRFATGPEGAAIIRQAGLWPEYELERVRADQRVADAKAAKEQPRAVCDLAGTGQLAAPVTSRPACGGWLRRRAGRLRGTSVRPSRR